MCEHKRLARWEFDAQRGHWAICQDCGTQLQVERAQFWALDWPESSTSIPVFVPPKTIVCEQEDFALEPLDFDFEVVAQRAPNRRKPAAKSLQPPDPHKNQMLLAL